jgi:hypothetical protein
MEHLGGRSGSGRGSGRARPRTIRGGRATPTAPYGGRGLSSSPEVPLFDFSSSPSGYLSSSPSLYTSSSPAATPLMHSKEDHRFTLSFLIDLHLFSFLKPSMYKHLQYFTFLP